MIFRLWIFCSLKLSHIYTLFFEILKNFQIISLNDMVSKKIGWHFFVKIIFGWGTSYNVDCLLENLIRCLSLNVYFFHRIYQNTICRKLFRIFCASIFVFYLRKVSVSALRTFSCTHIDTLLDYQTYPSQKLSAAYR